MLGEMLGHRVREGHPITTHVPAVALYLWSGTHGEVEVFSVRREDRVSIYSSLAHLTVVRMV